jgi:hypothetical protein
MAPDDELRQTLRDAATAPSGHLDVQDVRRRARRVVRNRQIATAAAVLALLVPAGLLSTFALRPVVDVDLAQGPAAGGGPVATAPTPTPSVSTPAQPSAPRAPGPQAPRPGGGLALPQATATGTPTGTPSPSGTAAPTPRSTEGRESYATIEIQDPGERRPDLPGDARHPAVVLSLTVERTEVTQGAKWQGWLEVRNTGDEPIDLGDADCWGLWGLYQDGAWVGGQAGTTCGDTKHPGRTLKPASSWRVPFQFDTVAGDERGKGQTSLPPGEYQAAAGVRVSTRAHPWSGVWYAPSVRVTVTAPSDGG